MLQTFSSHVCLFFLMTWGRKMNRVDLRNLKFSYSSCIHVSKILQLWGQEHRLFILFFKSQLWNHIKENLRGTQGVKILRKQNF